MFTLVLMGFTSFFSVLGFMIPGFIEKYYFSPYRVYHHHEHYRFLSHAFIHAGFLHLGLNLLAFYSFGIVLEEVYFPELYGYKLGKVMYLLLFTGSIYASSLLELYLYKNRKQYASLGISGTVSAVIFSFIIISPLSEIYFFFFPLKGWIAGILILGVSFYLIRKKRKGDYHDPISHESHYCGALFGVLFMLITRPSLGLSFIKTILESFGL
jgi:membrane associated rhomboid family serine protease